MLAGPVVADELRVAAGAGNPQPWRSNKVADLKSHLRDLVVANRILANEGAIDGFGHVSIRHPERPDRFFMSCSRSPGVVSEEDLIEFTLDCEPINQNGRRLYGERPIHGAVYQARPEINAVIHSHPYDVIPFTVTDVKLRPLLHVAGPIGEDIPVWNMADKFGPSDFIVRKMEEGHDLARCMGDHLVVLMRGHGATIAGHTTRQAVLTAIYLVVNARLQLAAMQLGTPQYLSSEEIELTTKMAHGYGSVERNWEYWSQRCGMEVSDHSLG
jgi:ribulose-5-phosphate 4-epimerase/fuculose-1-phosphate aldolase